MLARRCVHRCTYTIRYNGERKKALPAAGTFEWKEAHSHSACFSLTAGIVQWYSSRPSSTTSTLSGWYCIASATIFGVRPGLFCKHDAQSSSGNDRFRYSGTSCNVLSTSAKTKLYLQGRRGVVLERDKQVKCTRTYRKKSPQPLLLKCCIYHTTFQQTRTLAVLVLRLEAGALWYIDTYLVAHRPVPEHHPCTSFQTSVVLPEPGRPSISVTDGGLQPELSGPCNAMTSSEERTSAGSESNRPPHREVMERDAPPPLRKGGRSNPSASSSRFSLVAKGISTGPRRPLVRSTLQGQGQSRLQAV